MKYSVLWTPTARRLLAQLWLTAANRNQVQQAADEIDRVLQRDPLNAGESRVVNIRIIIEPPLAAYFDVVEKDRRVTVWRIWSIGGKTDPPRG